MIQDLNPAHAESMSILHGQAFDPPWPVKDFRDHTANPHDVVLGCLSPKVHITDPEIEPVLSGFVICRCQADQAEILTLIVDRSQHRSGLGRDLMEAVQSRACDLGVEVIFLEVAKDNIAALALYRSLGFVGITTRKAYYRRAGGRVDALVLSKNITAR